MVLRRNGWCVSCDGELLLFTADVMTQELRHSSEEDEAHPYRGELEQIIEQCYYCLYGHPSKRTKAKHLQDHGVAQVNFGLFVISSNRDTKTSSHVTYAFVFDAKKGFHGNKSYFTSEFMLNVNNLLRTHSLYLRLCHH